ncbi:MAG TPA: hypothetical protein VN809_01295 [Telmatospirillum sp.]|nr:hypothetical protein [Telmatospirillum sp.]
MATEGVSSTRASGGVVSQTSGGAQSTAGASPSRGSAPRTQTGTRQVINIDGQSFDRRVPRGTYLNIVV